MESDYRSHILERVNGSIPHPYFDVKELRRYGSRLDRVSRMMGYDNPGHPLPEGHIPEASLCCWYADRVIRDWMCRNKIKGREMAEFLQVDQASVSNFVRYKRRFACQLEMIQPLCGRMEISPNQFLMGCKGIVLLPDETSFMAKQLVKMDYLAVDKLRRSAEKLWRKHMRSHRSDQFNGLHRPLPELICDRFDLIKPTNVPLRRYYGDIVLDNPQPLRTVMDYIGDIDDALQKKKALDRGDPDTVPLTEEENRLLTSSIPIQLPTFLVMVVESGYPVEWFVCDHAITSRTVLRYRDGKAGIQPLRRSDIKALFDLYYALPQEMREELKLEILEAIQ